MKRRLPNWMVGETFSQSDKHTNKCAVQPLFATDDTVPPADPVSLSESPDNRQQIRILRPSQINSIVLNIAEDVSAISNGTSIAVSNTSESDLAIQANEQEGNSTNQEEDIKMEADLALLEQLESNIHESERDRTADQRVELNTDTTSAGPSVLPDVVPHIPAQPEIKSEPSTQSAPESTPPKVKVETPGTMPVSTVQTATSSTTNTAGRVSCNYGVKCFRYATLIFNFTIYVFNKFLLRCRRNPQHRNDMAHPGDPDYRRPEFPEPPSGTPACPFGASCYRRNPQHFVQLHHPPASE